ncbi:MAG TPA: MerR family transcriptional regulator [Acidimicrobiia bacterium]|nr:MerR family transcriptional regulator [Acidimicrobiia bacterium]
MAVDTAAPRLRVEDLARRADVSVDTIRFYQKRRLLPPPAREGRIGWYGPEHLERLRRIRDLRAEGLTLALIGRLLNGELDPADAPLAAAVAAAQVDERDDAPATEHVLTLAELAAAADVPLPLLEAVAHEGLLVARVVDGEERYTSADADVVRAGLRLLERGLPMPELLALARAHHDATREVAERAVAMFDAHVRQPLRASALSDDEKAEQLVDAFRVLLPAVTGLVSHHFRRTLLAVAQEHLEAVGEASEVAAATVEAERQLEREWTG